MKEPSYYFSDKSLALLQNLEFVWDAIRLLPSYLEKVELGVIEVDVPEGVFLENPHLISIGKGTLIEPGVYIKGPALIGKGCEIRHGAYIRGNVIIEDGAIVGHSTEVKNSILLKRAHAAHFNYVGDSILGEDSNIGAGVICANFRLDQGEVSVRIDDKKFRTGSKKLGLILGDRSQIGCNSVVSPGTLVGKDVLCYPCMHVQGTIPSNSKRKLKQRVEEG
jgi:UDP-N-acetylglucosamine diphosphorylase / glucose-1-phosphate thymidylyltransferase / UDP-N-acetylgalactosamine diphosphorylase / glucosamine-1-phosphate N-acetyltransferase / galactosamine-1-phosphate N-acetyltransferase